MPPTKKKIVVTFLSFTHQWLDYYWLNVKKQMSCRVKNIFTKHFFCPRDGSTSYWSRYETTNGLCISKGLGCQFTYNVDWLAMSIQFFQLYWQGLCPCLIHYTLRTSPSDTLFLSHSLSFSNSISQIVWPEKIAKCLYKLPTNDFTSRKMIDFDTFTKIA